MTRRRTVMVAAGVVVTGLVSSGHGSTEARADFISAPDVVVYCDPAVAAALREVGADFRARTGVPVRVFASPGTLQLELIARGTRTDVLVTLTSQMDKAAARGLVNPETRIGPWRDRVVFAARDVPAAEFDADAVARLLGDGRIAVIDPVGPDRMDGPAVLDRLGWTGTVRGRTDGKPTGQEVAFVVENGADRLGLLHRSDLAGHRRLSVVGAPPDDAAPPARYEAAIAKNVLSRNTVAFMSYLAGQDASERLARDGLEAAP